MTRKQTAFIICCASFVAAIVAPAAVTANSVANPGSPWIEEVAQEGPDVVLTVVMNVYNWSSVQLMALERTDDEGVHCVDKDMTFEASDALETESYCPEWSQSPMCESYPDNCVDCDGDDVPECLNDCGLNGWYELVDDCVPAGDAGYRLFGKWDGWDPWDTHGDLDVLPDEAECEPSAAAGPCDEPSSDSDVDSDADSDADSDSDTDNPPCDNFFEDDPDDSGIGSGCSVSLTVSSRSLEGCGLFALMLGIGLVAVVVRRRAR